MGSFYDNNKTTISNIITLFFTSLNIIHCILILYLIKEFEKDECTKKLLETHKKLITAIKVMAYYMIIMFFIIIIIIISGVSVNGLKSKILLGVNIINYIFIAIFIGVVAKFMKVIKKSNCKLSTKNEKYFESTSKWIYILILILIITVIEFIYKHYSK
jgi:uncharacterized membrane protein